MTITFKPEPPIRFAGSVLENKRHIMGVLWTHPMVIIGGVLQESPFFILPEQFSQELPERRLRNGSQPAPGPLDK